MTEDFDASPFRTLLDQAKAGFSTDSAYMIRIAEAHAAIQASAQGVADPDRAKKNILRLWRQGALISEIRTTLSIKRGDIEAVLTAEGIDTTGKTSGAVRDRPVARRGHPAPRPVVITYTAPTKTLADLPLKKRPEGIGRNQPRVSKYEGQECPSDHKHGSSDTCYGKHHCRCESCVQRNRDRQKKN